MSSALKSIAARYAGVLKVAGSLEPLSDEKRLHVLRCVMRYGLVWNRLAGDYRLNGKTREQMNVEEWQKFIAENTEFFNANLRDFGQDCTGYITHWMSWLFPDLKRHNPTAKLWRDRLAESEIPKVIEWFLALPDRADYGYGSQP